MLNNWKPFTVVTASNIIASQGQVYRVVLQAPGFPTFEEFEGDLDDCKKECDYLNQLISTSLALYLSEDKK